MTATKQEIHEYLIKLRDSGEINMWGAADYLEARFNMDKRAARDALLEWIRSFSKEKTNADSK